MDWNSIISSALTQAIGPAVVVYALAAIGLNVQFGYTGLLNFGQAGFAAVGAYGMGVVVASYSASLWLGVVVGLAAAVVLALLLGVPTLRLRADYLAIATIAAAEIIRRLARSVHLREWTNGSDGLSGFVDQFRELGYAIGLERGARFRFGPFFYTAADLWVMIVGWALIVLCLLVVWLSMRSPWGRVLKAIREDEDAVRSLGKNVVWYKMQALTLGGLIGALAGFMQAFARGVVQPDNFSTEFTFYLYAMVILGGAARVFGPLVGAVLFWFLWNFLNTFLREASREGIIPASILDANQVGPVVFMALGVGIILLLIYRPQGIFGDKREISLDVR